MIGGGRGGERVRVGLALRTFQKPKQRLTGAWQGDTLRICAPSLQAVLMRPHVVGTLWLLPDAL